MLGHWATRLPGLHRLCCVCSLGPLQHPTLSSHFRPFSSSLVHRILKDDNDDDDFGIFARTTPKTVPKTSPKPSQSVQSTQPARTTSSPQVSQESQASRAAPPFWSIDQQAGAASSRPTRSRGLRDGTDSVFRQRNNGHHRNGQVNSERYPIRASPPDFSSRPFRARASPGNGQDGALRSRWGDQDTDRSAKGQRIEGPYGRSSKRAGKQFNEATPSEMFDRSGAMNRGRISNTANMPRGRINGLNSPKSRLDLSSNVPSFKGSHERLERSQLYPYSPSGRGRGLEKRSENPAEMQSSAGSASSNKAFPRFPDASTGDFIYKGRGDIVRTRFGNTHSEDSRLGEPAIFRARPRRRDLDADKPGDYNSSDVLEQNSQESINPSSSAAQHFPKAEGKPSSFYDIDSLLTTISSQVDTPRHSVLPSVKARERVEKHKYAKLGLEPAPDGTLRPHSRKKYLHAEERERAAEMEDRRKWRAEKERRQAERAAQRLDEPIPIILPDFITVANLARALNVSFNKFVRTMKELGFDDCRHDYILNAETAGLVASELGFAPQNGSEEDDGDLYPAPPPPEQDLVPRPPVVTIMGHVDHGKTTLLDYLRSSAVAAQEHGGITQHIGAFSVRLSSGQTITFLDTPGHAAFLAMRQRGASVTDIVVLVVAADDGVMPQTVEAIRHAREAGVPLIVAINKMDREDANADKVKESLYRAGVEVEDHGGDTQAVHVSGKTGLGMTDLEEAIITLAETLELKSDPVGPVEGWVVEAQKRLSGMTATMIVRRGTLRVGDVVVAGTAWARVRTLRNESGESLTEVGPGCPVEVEGWREQPDAGDEVLQARDEQHASEVIDIRHAKAARDKLGTELAAMNEARGLRAKARDEAAELADIKRSIAGRGAKEVKEKPKPSIVFSDSSAGGASPSLLGQSDSGLRLVPFIIKADVDGSAEAVSTLIGSIGNTEVGTQVLRSDIGTLTSSDVEFAATTGARLISFNVPVPPNIVRDANAAGVAIISESVIYRVDERVREELSTLLDPIVTKVVTGEAEIVQSFEIDGKLPGTGSGGSGGGSGSRKGKIKVAGCKVKNGVVTRNSRVRVLRGPLGSEPEVVFDGKFLSLKQIKKDVMEVRKDGECGMIFEDGWGDMMVGDRVQCYNERSERRKL